jgi:hypothetical protein
VEKNLQSGNFKFLFILGFPRKSQKRETKKNLPIKIYYEISQQGFSLSPWSYSWIYILDASEKKRLGRLVPLVLK